MRVSILCSSVDHPVYQYLKTWQEENKSVVDIEIVQKKSELHGGDLLFLISCSELVDEKTRLAYRKSLVLHASDLPKGRGWSPHIWEILSGAQQITLSLLEVREPIDSGPIWKKITIPIPKDALWDEINHLLFQAELELMDFSIEAIDDIVPLEQPQAIEPTYYRKRKPEDSLIDPNESLVSQFNKIRVCDPLRFPAFFELHGHQYRIKLEKLS